MADRDDRGSFLRDALGAVTRAVTQSPRVSLWCVLLTCFACVALAVTGLKFKTQRSDLIDPQAAFHQRWLQYTEKFGDGSDIVVVVESDDPQTIKQVLEEVGQRLQREPDYFANILFKVDPGPLRSKGLQYVAPQQLESGLQRLAEYKPVLQGRWDLVQLDSLISRLSYQIQSRGRQAKHLDPLLNHADRLSGSMLRYVTDSRDFRSSWPELLSADSRLGQQVNSVTYFLNDAGTLGYLRVMPVHRDEDFSGSSASIARLQEIVKEVSQDHPETSVSATGIPILEHDEMQRSQTDMLKASLISLVGVGIMLFVGFRGLRHPALALLMLVVGMCWAFGFATVSVGHLNILSVSFAAILIGLGIDFAIHYLARYLELRHSGSQLHPALQETSGSVGTGIVTAAVTTALAFFCATFTGFLGVAELGIIAAGGILLCALATFLVLPSLIALADRDVEPRRLPTPFRLSALRRLTVNFPLPVFLISLALIGASASQIVEVRDGNISPRVEYDYNLLNLQADGVESVDLQKRMFQESDSSLLFAVSVADTAEQAQALRAEFEQLPTVHHVDELATRLPSSSSDQTRLLVQGFHSYLAHLPQRVPRVTAPDPSRFGRAVERLFLDVRRMRNPRAQRVARNLDRFLNEFDRLSLRSQMAFLGEFQVRTTAALFSQLQGLAAVSDPDPIVLSDLPQELTSRFVSTEGKWLLQVYPQEQIWDIEPLARFVDDVRSVDPDATGTPLQNYEASRQIKQSYESAAWYALAIICIVLLVDFLNREHCLMTLVPPAIITAVAAVMMHAKTGTYEPMLMACMYVGMAAAIAVLLDPRNLRDIVLTLLPPIAGGLLMFGIFAVLKIDLNPANLIVLPLVLGIGVDDGVHVVHDYRLQRGNGYRTSASTMNAVVLTSLTTMIGFGSLMLAAHRGLSSVGLVMVIGVGSCLFVSLVMLPAILTLVSQPQPTETTKTAKPAETRSKSKAA